MNSSRTVAGQNIAQLNAIKAMIMINTKMHKSGDRPFILFSFVVKIAVCEESFNGWYGLFVMIYFIVLY